MLSRPLSLASNRERATNVRACAQFWPEVTERPDLTDKGFDRVSENLCTWVSVRWINPTWIFVYDLWGFSEKFWARLEVCGKHLIPGGDLTTTTLCGIVGRMTPFDAAVPALPAAAGADPHRR